MPIYNLLIATPNETLFDADVTAATFFGVDGLFEILPNHAPLIARIKGGVVKITDAHGRTHNVEVGAGFLEFHANKGVLLTSST